MRKEWEYNKLGNILTIERGGSPRPIEKYLTNSPDGINWIKISDATASDKFIYETREKIIREGLGKTRVVNEGDFILSNSMSFGRPYIMKTSGCIHDGWLVLRQNDKIVFDTEFLYYLLSSPYVNNQFDYLAAGSTVRNLNIALVSSVIVPLPPLSEQKRIVAQIDECFTSIAKAKVNAEQNLRNAKELFESYLKNIFENKGEGWKEKKLGEVIELISGQHIDAKDYNFEEKGIAYLTGPSDFGDIHPIVTKWTEYPKKIAIKNDILITVKGSGVGKVNFVNFDNVCISRQLMAIRARDIDVSFLYAYISTKFKYFQSLSNGAAIPGISREDVLDLKVCLPNHEDQIRLVHQINYMRTEIHKLEAIYHKKLEALEELKKSILQKAFAGELVTDKEVTI